MSAQQRDPYFARFAFTVITIAIIIVVLGLTFIWYFFQSGGANSPSSPLRNLFGKNTALSPNQAMLYYTKDGKQLVSTVSNVGSAGMSSTDKAKIIVTHVIEGKDAAFLKTPVPAGTRMNSVFVNDDIVIVNLSREFITNLRGGVDAELLAVYSIVNSLLYNIENVTAVQLLIDGEKLPTMGGHIDIEAPLIANAAITRSS